MRRRTIVGGMLAGGTLALGLGWAGARLLGQRARGTHTSETEEGYREARHRVLILGAGFGGLAAALNLDKQLGAMGTADGTSVLLIGRDNSLLFTPLLWTVADGRSNPNDVVVPIRAFQHRRGFHLLQAVVEHIDLEQHVVQTSAGPRPFDTLVLALGSVTAVPPLPGLREHAEVFHSPADAVQLRNRLIDSIEAAHNTQDPEERKEWLTFVVSGGGDTGIELAAVIHDYLASGLFASYPWLADMRMRIVIVGRASMLVPMSDPATSESVRRLLEDEGVEVMTGISVIGMTNRIVHTSAGDIAARTLFWAAGITAPEVVRALPVEHASNGAVLVDDHLRVRGHPNVYAVGDCAWAFDAETHRGLPPTAQAAEHMGRYVGRAIAAQLSGQESDPFRFTPVGHLALLGRRTGVARVGPVTLTGIPAWLLWHAYYLSHIPSWRKRLDLAVSWLLSGVTGRETGELRLSADSEPAGVEAKTEHQTATPTEEIISGSPS